MCCTYIYRERERYTHIYTHHARTHMLFADAARRAPERKSLGPSGVRRSHFVARHDTHTQSAQLSWWSTAYHGQWIAVVRHEHHAVCCGMPRLIQDCLLNTHRHGCAKAILKWVLTLFGLVWFKMVTATALRTRCAQLPITSCRRLLYDMIYAIHIYIYIYTHICLYTYIYITIYIYSLMYIDISLSLSLSLSLYIYIYTYT